MTKFGNSAIARAEDPAADAAACCCGASAAVKLWSASHDRAGARNYRYSILRCAACNLARTSPTPGGGDPMTLYRDGYGEEWIKSESHMASASDFRLRDVMRLRPAPARVLDLGCAAGWMVEMLSRAGYRAEGVEVDRMSVEYARSRGRKVHHGTLAQASFEDGTLDLVLMSHVLEHLAGPDEVVAEVTRVLAPGGLLLIYVPNFRSFAGRLMRNKWGFLVPHGHVWQFEPASLRTVVERASGGALGLAWMKTNTLLEYSDAGVWWKTAIKSSVLHSAAALGYGDEIRAAFRKTSGHSGRSPRCDGI